MKRFFVWMTAAALFLSIVCAASAQTFSTAYFTIKLPDGWEIDTDDLEKKENEETLGFFGGETSDGFVLGGAYLVYYENLKDISLWNASEEELQEYADALLEDYEDTNPQLIGTVTAGKIPLVLIRGADKDGEFVYADTMTNGYAIEFEFYVTDDEGDQQLPITDEHIVQIETILASFEPAA